MSLRLRGFIFLSFRYLLLGGWRRLRLCLRFSLRLRLSLLLRFSLRLSGGVVLSFRSLLLGSGSRFGRLLLR